MGWFSDAVDAVSDVVSDTADAIGDAAEEVWEDVTDAAEDFSEDVQDSWDTAFEHGVTLTGFVGGMLGMLGAGADFIFDVIGAVSGGLLSASISILGGFVGVIVSIFAPDAGVKVAKWINDFGRVAGEFVEEFFDAGGSFIEWIFGLGARFFNWLSEWWDCTGRHMRIGRTGTVRGGKPIPSPTSFDDIDHFFVLMLENRSFDHMLGHSDIEDIEGLSGDLWINTDLQEREVRASLNAWLKLKVDAPHSFMEIQLQTGAGQNSDGFAKVYHRYLIDEIGKEPDLKEISQIMAGFTSETAPIIHSLARQFALCDHWFCSVPGPTVPNRLFAYAGSSGWLAGEPDPFMLGGSFFKGLGFENGSLFDLLDRNCIPWRVYHGDQFPMVNMLRNVQSSHVGDYRDINPRTPSKDDFANDLASADSSFPAFTLIEPDYGEFATTFESGNSQHPIASIAPGERLIKHVYESLRASVIRDRSVLIITYDEHGGFFDHMIPPKAKPPGDQNWNQSLQRQLCEEVQIDELGDALGQELCIDLTDYSAARYGVELSKNQLNPFKFQFDRLGVRVPTIVISSLISSKVVKTVFDHTSIIRTVCDRFGLRGITQRDKHANSLRGIFDLTAPREIPSTLGSIFTGS